VGLGVGNGTVDNDCVVEARDDFLELIAYRRLSRAFLKRYMGVVTEWRIST